MWKVFFKVIGIKPGKVVTPAGTLNLANTRLAVLKIKEAYDAGCPYLEPTERGLKKFYSNLAIRPLPDKLPVGIQVLDLNLNETSGNGDQVLFGEHTLELNLNETSGNGDQALSDEDIVAEAITRGILVKKGAFLYRDAEKYGSKAILKNTEVLAELRQLLV